MKKLSAVLASCLLLTACHKAGRDPELVSIQFIDRNGFSESISTKDRLDNYKSTDFSTPQPYQKVTRFFKRNHEGRIHSMVTSYHENGSLWQELEVINGRANGKFREWHPNGQLKLEATVLEGLGDLSETCINSWVFHGESRAWNGQGTLIANIVYHRGVLEGVSHYYYPSGQLREKIPYVRGKIHGNLLQFDEKGNLVRNARYRDGEKDGLTVFKGMKGCPRFTEEYKQGLLMKAAYYDFDGNLHSEIVDGFGTQAVFQEGKLKELHQFRGGLIEGEVKKFDDRTNLINQFTIKNGQKHGEEHIYFEETQNRKLSLEWYEDELQGKVKTFYSNGQLETEKEMYQNKRHGRSLAWYRDGSLMLMEEYEHDVLSKGEYFAKGSHESISEVEEGDGVATLYDADGHFIRRISYFKGHPFDE